MDTLQRYLPIVVVVIFALMVNPYQANAQTFPKTVPLQFDYQSGNVNDLYTANQAGQNQTSTFRFNGLWLLAILAIPAAYFLWTKTEARRPYRETAARGYSIAYQDIRRFKKKNPRNFKVRRRPRIF